jgi:hypothetical protein
MNSGWAIGGKSFLFLLVNFYLLGLDFVATKVFRMFSPTFSVTEILENLILFTQIMQLVIIMLF